MEKYILISLICFFELSILSDIQAAARQPCSIYYDYDDEGFANSRSAGTHENVSQGMLDNDSDEEMPSFEPADSLVSQIPDNNDDNLLFYSLVSPVQTQVPIACSLQPEVFLRGFGSTLDCALRIDYDAYVKKVAEIRQNPRFAVEPAYFEAKLRSCNRGFLPLTTSAKNVMVAYFLDRMDALPCSCKDFLLQVAQLEFFGIHDLSVRFVLNNLEPYESYRRNRTQYSHRSRVDFLEMIPLYYFNVWYQRHI